MILRQGIQHHRLRQNPRERLFKIAWEQINDRSLVSDDAHTVLGHILTPPEMDQRYPLHPSERDWLVANTVVQWLGSSVGQSFLRAAKHVCVVDAMRALDRDPKAAKALAELVKP